MTEPQKSSSDTYGRVQRMTWSSTDLIQAWCMTFDLVVAMALVPQERFQGGRDRVVQREHVAQRDVLGRVDVVGDVLLGAMMAQPDLVLVAQPGLVVVGLCGVEDLLAEPLPHPVKVALDGLL